MAKKVISQLVIMLIIIFMGFLAKKKNLITEEGGEGVQAVLLKITFPCMLFMALQREYSPHLNREFLKTFGAGLVVIMACYVVFLLILKYIAKVSPDKMGIYLLGAAFGNVSFMGIPVVNALYGADAVLVSVANIFAFNILFFSAGVMACHFGEGNKMTLSEILENIFLNLPMIGILAGYAFFRFSIGLPVLLGNALESVGSVSGVLALFIVGFALSEVKLGELKDLNMFVSIGLGLVLAPVIARLVGGLILKDEISLGVIVITTATPAATSISALASAEGKDGVLASKLIFISTLLCIVTIPLVIKFLL